MAMSKRTVTKYSRRRYARGYRRYRSLSNQYFKAKIEGLYTIAFPTDPGAPVFAEPNSSSLTFGSIFSNSQYYGSLTAMFGYYKVYGVSMEVVPGSRNFVSGQSVGIKVLVGFKCGTSTSMTYNELVASNNAIVLGGSTRTRKYSSVMGSTGWTSVSEDIANLGNFSVAASTTGVTDRSPTFTIKLSLYMMFKKVNI